MARLTGLYYFHSEVSWYKDKDKEFYSQKNTNIHEKVQNAYIWMVNCEPVISQGLLWVT